MATQGFKPTYWLGVLHRVFSGFRIPGALFAQECIAIHVVNLGLAEGVSPLVLDFCKNIYLKN
jgi:hypothetical protein